MLNIDIDETNGFIYATTRKNGIIKLNQDGEVLIAFEIVAERVQEVSLSADKTKLLVTFYNVDGGILVLAAADFGVLRSGVINHSTPHHIRRTISNKVDKWYSLGGLSFNSLICVFLVITRQDTHDIVFRYFRHSS